MKKLIKTITIDKETTEYEMNATDEQAEILLKDDRYKLAGGKSEKPKKQTEKPVEKEAEKPAQEEVEVDKE